MKLQLRGITEDQILKICIIIEANGYNERARLLGATIQSEYPPS